MQTSTPPARVVNGTVVLRFFDGDAVVPAWWGRLRAFRRGPEHGDFVPPLPMTLEEARTLVNAELEANIVGMVMRDWIHEHRAAFG